MKDLPKIISVFPLSNFILFPKTTVPLNIFEPRYIDMMDESMKSNKMIGMVQPIISPSKNLSSPKLHSIGCMGKIISFKETNMQHYLIELKGKNGVEHGPGYPAGSVTGPVARAAQMGSQGSAVRLLPNAAWPAGHAP